jgi:hypothetical protein
VAAAFGADSRGGTRGNRAHVSAFGGRSERSVSSVDVFLNFCHPCVHSAAPCVRSAAGVSSCAMSNRFGVELHPDSVRWAAAEGVTQDVIAATLLLHEHSVDEIAPQLSATELEQVIKLVGRSPRLYARGMLEAFEQRKSWLAPTPPAESLPPKAAATEQTTGADRPHPRHASYESSGATGHPTTRTEIDANQMRLAHERRLEMLRAHTPQSAPEPARTVS